MYMVLGQVLSMAGIENTTFVSPLTPASIVFVRSVRATKLFSEHGLILLQSAHCGKECTTRFIILTAWGLMVTTLWQSLKPGSWTVYRLGESDAW